MARKLAAGNWKMNGTSGALTDLSQIAAQAGVEGVDVLICPPTPLISRAAEAVAGTDLAIGGQDCHAAEKGAHTGDISAGMLVDAGATYVILGHSERRTDHDETDAAVQAKVLAARLAGLVPIVCVGETLAQRDAGETLAVVRRQIAGSVPEGIGALVIAYEPVWAIGTGRVPTLDQIAEVHTDMRAQLEGIAGVDASAVPLLYGGSVKPGNAAEIFAVADVDGALVGGASLKAADFGPIIEALAAS